MTSILVIIGKIYHCYFKCNDAKKFKTFCLFLFRFSFLQSVLNFEKIITIKSLRKTVLLKRIKGSVAENTSAVNVLTCRKTRFLYRKDIVILLILKNCLHAQSRLNQTEQRKFIAKLFHKTKSIRKRKRLIKQSHYKNYL